MLHFWTSCSYFSYFRLYFSAIVGPITTNPRCFAIFPSLFKSIMWSELLTQFLIFRPAILPCFIHYYKIILGGLVIQIVNINPFRTSVPKISRYKSYNFSQTKVCIGSWNIDIEKSGVSTLFYWVLGVYVKRLLTESIENLHLIFFPIINTNV